MKECDFEIDFEAMLNSVAQTCTPIYTPCTPDVAVDVWRNLKKKGLSGYRKQIISKILSSYLYWYTNKANASKKSFTASLDEWELVDDNVGERNDILDDPKIRAKITSAATKAFKVVTGHSFNSAYRLNIGKVKPFVPSYIIKYEPYFNKILSGKYYKWKMKEGMDWMVIEQLMSENKGLTLYALFSGKVSGLDTFKEMKEALLKYGWTEADWKWFSKRSVAWITAAIRRNVVRQSVELRLPYSYVINPFVNLWFNKLPCIRSATKILHHEIKHYKGTMKSFMPFPVHKTENGYICRELDEIADYVRAADVSDIISLRRLKELSDQWHEEALKIKVGKFVEFKKYGNGVVDHWEKDGYTFSLIKDNHSLVKEGKEMHHCVGGYSHRCSSGSYIVFKIEGEERATLGLNVITDWANSKRDDDLYFGYNQCYSYCNKSVTDKTRTVVNEFIQRLNNPPKPIRIEASYDILYSRAV